MNRAQSVRSSLNSSPITSRAPAKAASKENAPFAQNRSRTLLSRTWDWSHGRIILVFRLWLASRSPASGCRGEIALRKATCVNHASGLMACIFACSSVLRSKLKFNIQVAYDFLEKMVAVFHKPESKGLGKAVFGR